MKTQSKLLIIIVLTVIGFSIYFAYLNEKKIEIPNLEEKINIKTPYEVKKPIINNEEGKG